MKDFIKKSKLLADLEKYEHELSTLESIKDYIDQKIYSVRNKIEQCRMLLKNTRKDGEKEVKEVRDDGNE
jgi:hypothetical protein